MKNNLIKFTACFITIFLLLFSVFTVSAKTDSSTAQTVFNEIIDYKINVSNTSSIQQLIDTSFTQNAGIDSEWYAIALSQYGNYNFVNYEKSLLNYIANNNISSAATQQKYALTLIAVDNKNDYIQSTLNNSIGKQGIMSWIFGLHLINNEYTSDSYSLSDVKQEIINLQLNDGGWAIRGKVGDVDVTAMAVQAFAPHYKNDSTVKNAVDKALDFLSSKQLDTGDYSSYGVSNAESSAQVLTALSSLGIDCITDKRFIKNNNTLFDVIQKYKVPSGGYGHEQGGEYSETATSQVFYSMLSYMRMQSGKTPLFIFDKRIDTSEPITTIADDKATEDSQSAAQSPYKLWVILGVVIIAVVICIILFIAKKRSNKNFIIIVAVASIIVLLVWSIDFQATFNYHNQVSIDKENTTGTVTLSIRCDVIADEDNENIPKDGIILDETEFKISENDTVFDIFTEAVQKYKLHAETTGNKNYAYIKGINNIYEFDYGELSGWLYFVNGESPSIGCGQYKLSDGDIIEFRYSNNITDFD